MKRYFIFIAFIVSLLAACASPTGDLEVHNAWARPTAQGENAAVYFTLHNHSGEEYVLTGATSNTADVLEIHESRLENDVMQMSMLQSLSIPAGDEIKFQPGSYHLMLISIKQEFVLGGHIGVVLHFQNHDDIVVNVHIEDSQPTDDHEHDE